ncbi:MAG: hypothetical protein JSV32_04145 [Dehalococcoidia bacterium]|nr:MAG: hypothetical protein JSV32_04145 [Dehalococcoidia bacterium]
MSARKIIVSVLLAILLLNVACGTSLAPVQPPNLDNVTDALGYCLAPTRMPEDFVFDQYDVSEIGTDSIARIMYERLHNHVHQYIFIMYPLSLPSSSGDNPLLEGLGSEWERPDDAVLEVTVNGEKAYLVHGNWSAGSLKTLENPEWDYDIYLSLYFDYRLPSGETAEVMIRAMLNPSEWITTTELVKTAESMQLIN